MKRVLGLSLRINDNGTASWSTMDNDCVHSSRTTLARPRRLSCLERMSPDL